MTKGDHVTSMQPWALQADSRRMRTCGSRQLEISQRHRRDRSKDEACLLRVSIRGEVAVRILAMPSMQHNRKKSKTALNLIHWGGPN